MLIQDTNTGRTTIDRAALPALTGSDKQVAWATELRDRRINKLCNDFDGIISNARAAGKTVTQDEIAAGMVKVWDANKAEILETSAKRWIDRR